MADGKKYSLGEAAVALLIGVPVATFLMALAIAPLAIFQGFVLLQFWGWFLADKLVTWTPTLAGAVGLMYLKGFLLSGVAAMKTDKEGDSEGTKFMRMIVTPYMTTALFWLLGYITSRFL